MAVFCIDTSSLITPWKQIPIDIFPRMWRKLEDWARSGMLIAPDEVRREVTNFESKKSGGVKLVGQKKEDGLSLWMNQLPTDMFKPITQDLLDAHRNVLCLYGDAALETEDPWADPWVIALSLLDSATVITEESNRGKGMQSKIPYICGRLHVRCVTLFGLFRETRTVF